MKIIKKSSSSVKQLVYFFIFEEETLFESFILFYRIRKISTHMSDESKFTNTIAQ